MEIAEIEPKLPELAVLILDFYEWAEKFSSISEKHIQEFMQNCPNNLSLHEMKRLFAEKYQDRIEFSYVLGVEKKIVIDLHIDESISHKYGIHHTNHMSVGCGDYGFDWTNGGGEGHGQQDFGYGDSDLDFGYGEGFSKYIDHVSDNGTSYLYGAECECAYDQGASRLWSYYLNKQDGSSRD